MTLSRSHRLWLFSFAVLLPPLALLYCGYYWQALFALVLWLGLIPIFMALSLVCPPASIWACSAAYRYLAEQRK